jgi:hypothetical protein
MRQIWPEEIFSLNDENLPQVAELLAECLMGERYTLVVEQAPFQPRVRTSRQLDSLGVTYSRFSRNLAIHDQDGAYIVFIDENQSVISITPEYGGQIRVIDTTMSGRRVIVFARERK